MLSSCPTANQLDRTYAALAAPPERSKSTSRTLFSSRIFALRSEQAFEVSDGAYVRQCTDKVAVWRVSSSQPR